ncbi:hypothetical protein GCM10022197_42570 [Microlunatus spumicola]|uniref:Uncharacterized protein n=1 Tax=Microlunatus spumicola TaxID=81499 RepID=A0ABP6YGE7_9ACTN
MATSVGELGPALASWNDFVGTAAADESGPDATGPSLYEAAGLDPATWIILGVDLGTATPATLVVYALDRAVHGVSTHADLIDLGHRSGELAVTAFELCGPEALRRGAAAFERLSVRLVARPFHDQRLVVHERRALPVGPPPTDPASG